MDSKYIRSSRDKPCQVMLEGCMPENNSVEFMHLSSNGMKPLDIQGVYACLNCRDIINGERIVEPPYEKEWLELQELRAVVRTQRIMHRNGLLGCLKL
tara:strand:+ start:61 stop:354 length:294 start_codon:yes stop_codon:yes gene_type:complete